MKALWPGSPRQFRPELLIAALSVAFALASQEAGAAGRDIKYKCKGFDNVVKKKKAESHYGMPAEVVFQVKDNVVQVTGAYENGSFEVAIGSETGDEIRFSDFGSGKYIGESGSFDKVTGKLRLDSMDGISTDALDRHSHETFRWWGEYDCQPAN